MKRVTRLESNVENCRFSLAPGGDEAADCVDVLEMDDATLKETAKFYKCSPKLLQEIGWSILNLAESAHEDLVEMQKEFEKK